MAGKMLRLRKRPEFLAVQKGEKRRGALFLLELRQRPQGRAASAAAPRLAGAFMPAGGKGADCELSKAEAALLPRIGLTVSRKNGNSVCRSRIKRRLRAAARAAGIAELAEPRTDYVIIARPEILTVDFAALAAELRRRFQPGFAPPRRRGKADVKAAGKSRRPAGQQARPPAEPRR